MLLNYEARTDLNIKGGHDMPPSFREPTVVPTGSLLPVAEIQRTDEGEKTVEESGRGRRKRASRHVGALNGCLCGMVVNPGVDSNKAIECRQPGCETRWVCYMALYTRMY